MNNATLRLQNYIDSQLLPPRADRYIDVFEPATGSVFAACPDSDADDVEMSRPIRLWQCGGLVPIVGRAVKEQLRA